ncbi:hypothetical protein ACFS7Z_22550 [Pontibacter toksunensis]|uniref:Peptidase M48 domain-containing protein n=1 Tax=Pontibacter toksunensis TaxID=1332631 RepID=A0ABW6C1S5_9BACT
MARAVAETQFLENEALSLLGRLEMVKPFALNTPMVRAAAISAEAQNGITFLLNRVSQEVKQKIEAYIAWLKNPSNASAPASEAQARFAYLKLRFNNLLDQLDIFADVLSQRGEHNTGVWLAGLDVLAMDALSLRGNFYHPPPLVCFVERGHGAAIRRARTRLPGGDDNPVAVIQVPRERLIGSGIASSIVHEVGHQGAALLNLVDSVKEAISEKIAEGHDEYAWQLLDRWISEILSDFWAMANLGIGATLGLMNVVSLPSYFVFRVATDGPHPFPWIRVKISIVLGNALFPHLQWKYLEKKWESFYPPNKQKGDIRRTIRSLERILPSFADLVVNHRPKSVKGQALKEIFPVADRQPAHLQKLFQRWRYASKLMDSAAPTLVFAVLGQAKSDGNLSTVEETHLLQRLLTRWALIRSLHHCGAGNQHVVEAVQHSQINFTKQQLQLL